VVAAARVSAVQAGVREVGHRQEDVVVPGEWPVWEAGPVPGMPTHSDRGWDDRPQGIAGTGDSAQAGGKAKQPLVAQGNRFDEAGLDVEREAVEPLTGRAAEADRG